MSAIVGLERSQLAGPSGRIWTGGQPHIMICEDDPELALGLSIRLGTVYDVTTHASGEATIASYGAWRPDLLRLDYCLPDMTGIEALDEIRRVWGGEVPAVLLSAYPNVAEVCRSAGVETFIEKPADTGDMIWAIEHALHHL